MNVDGVPEFLTREQYVTLIESVGFDRNKVRKLEFRFEGIYAEVNVTDSKGRSIIAGDEMAVHRVFIPVRDAVAND